MGEGEDSNHEITPKEPESESDKSETTEQLTRIKQNRRPNHHTIAHKFLAVFNTISVTSVQYFLSQLTYIHHWHSN